MNRDTRAAFRQLKIPRPDKVFLTYPAPQLLFKKMEPIQIDAVRAMTGKGLLSADQSPRESPNLTELGRLAFHTTLAEAVSADEVRLIQFLTTDFATLDQADTDTLRQMTGLRRAVL